MILNDLWMILIQNIEEHNSNKKIKIPIVSDNLNADMHCNKNFDPIVNGLFIRGKKLN